MFMIILYLLSVEPVGTKSPTFSSDVKFSGISRNLGISFAILCQAQAFPVPLFRLVLALLLYPNFLFSWHILITRIHF